MKKILDRFYALLNSPRFVLFIIGFFIFEAVWIAFSAAYPQAFDENFHFGIIQIYARHWSPFLTHQPRGGDSYGAVARDPSYLYQYLMSFPYRIIKHIMPGVIGQIIALRLLNVLMFAGGLVLTRLILLRVGLSRGLANISIFLFILIPIVPQLASQINYDNMLIPLVAVAILLTFKISDEIRALQPRITSLLSLISLCFFTSLVKYAFLPIFLGIFIYLILMVLHSYHKDIKVYLSQLIKSAQQTAKPVLIALLLLCILSIGMFIQRDGVNLYRYQSFEPNCSAALSITQCRSYSPWYYNYLNHNKVVAHKGSLYFTDPVTYTFKWIYWMWFRLFFAVNGPGSGFTNYPPLPLPSAAAVLLGLFGAFATIKWRRKIFHNNAYLVLLFIVSACYLLALLGQGYVTYRYTDVLENMNGRYLLPVLLFVIAIVGRALTLELRDATNRKIILSMAIVVLFLQGGGIFTFIERSDNSWDFNNKTVVKINDTARHITKPVLVRGKKSYDTKYWIFN